MYNRFFNLKENPFSETPDTRFFYRSAPHVEALSRLAQLLDNGQGFALLTGEVGIGKTFLSRTLLNLAEKSAESALLLFPMLEGRELLEAILEEFGVQYGPEDSVKTLCSHLSDFLMKNAEAGKTTLLVIDEAQNMSLESLELVRMISNIELENQKLLQVILVGQQELETKLLQPEARQVNQRIAQRVQLFPFSRQETAKYLRHRLEVAGGNNFIRFEEKALELVHSLAKGLPRLINLQGRLILEYASRKEIRIIDERTVRQSLLEAKVLVKEGRLPWTSEEKLVQS